MADISYKPVINKMVWSHSRVKAFEMCPYGWYLKYICKLPSKELFFSSYGSFVHNLLERYYNGELAKSQLLYKYLSEFKMQVTARAPTPAIFKKYFQDGVSYFKQFQRLPYEVKKVEEELDGEIGGVKFRGIIDCRAEDDDGVILIDNKSRTLKPRSGKSKPTKSDLELDHYFIQLYLYSHLVESKYQLPISQIGFNCFRCDPPLIMEKYSQEKADFAANWLVENVAKISEETEFKPDMDMFKCKNLCDMQDHCEFYQMTFGR